MFTETTQTSVVTGRTKTVVALAVIIAGFLLALFTPTESQTKNIFRYTNDDGATV